MRKEILFIFLIISFFTSCASKKTIGLNEVSNISIPDKWEIEIASSIDLNEKWWEEFNDPILNRYLTTFLDKNIDIEKVMLNTRKAKQGAVLSTSNLFPTFSGSINGSESEQNTAGFPPIFSTLFGQNSDDVDTFNQENYNLSLNTQWEIDLWGKLRQGRLASKQQYLSIYYYEDFLRLSLVAEATKLYFSIIEAEQLVKNAEKKNENAEVLFNLYDLRYRKGSISNKAYQQSKILLNSSRSDLENKKNILNTLKREANSLNRYYPSTDFIVSPNLPNSLPEFEAVIPADIVKKRPDLIAQQYNLLSSSALDKQALRTLLPTFNVVGSYGTSTNELQDLLKEDFTVWSQGINLFLPIFNAGKLVANKKIAKSNKEIAMLDFINSVLNAYKEIENYLQADLVSQNTLSRFEENIISSKQIYDSSIREFEMGIITFEETLNASNEYYQNLDLLAGIKKIRLEQRINLILAFGGGFKYIK